MQRTITRRTERAHVLNTDEIRATLKHLGIWPDMRNNERLTITAMDFDGKDCTLTVRTTLVEVPITAEQPMPPAPVAMTSEQLRKEVFAPEAQALESLALLGPASGLVVEAWRKFDKTLKPFAQQVGRMKRCTCTGGGTPDGQIIPSPDCPVHGDDARHEKDAHAYLKAELGKATPADLPAMGVPAIPAWPPVAQRAALRCVCRDKIGDNGPCPAHPAIPQPEPAVPIITGPQIEAMTDPRATPAPENMTARIMADNPPPSPKGCTCLGAGGWLNCTEHNPDLRA